MFAAQSMFSAKETLKNLDIEIKDNILSQYSTHGVSVENMIKIIQNNGKYNPSKLIITSDLSHIGTIDDLIDKYKSMNNETKLLIVGWAEEPRMDLDFGKSKFTAINNYLFMDKDIHVPLTIESIGLAYHGRTSTRLKVYELKLKRTKKRKFKTVFYVLVPYTYRDSNNHCTNVYHIFSQEN